jgi:hypothetical protein
MDLKNVIFDEKKVRLRFTQNKNIWNCDQIKEELKLDLTKVLSITNF